MNGSGWFQLVQELVQELVHLGQTANTATTVLRHTQGNGRPECMQVHKITFPY